MRDVNEPGPMGPMSAQTAGPTGLWTWSNTIRTQYAGMEKDVPTGLDHTPFRKYDSGWGRWTSPDPYGASMSTSDPQSFNRYSYVRNDPVNATDPSGLTECSEFDASGACVVRASLDDPFWDIFNASYDGNSAMPLMLSVQPIHPVADPSLVGGPGSQNPETRA